MMASRWISAILWTLVSVNMLTLVLGGLITWLGYSIPIRLGQLGLSARIVVAGGFASLLVACIGLCALNYSSHLTLNIYGCLCSLLALVLLLGVPESWHADQTHPMNNSSLPPGNSTLARHQPLTVGAKGILLDLIYFTLLFLLLVLLVFAFLFAHYLRKRERLDLLASELRLQNPASGSMKRAACCELSSADESAPLGCTCPEASAAFQQATHRETRASKRASSVADKVFAPLDYLGETVQSSSNQCALDAQRNAGSQQQAAWLSAEFPLYVNNPYRTNDLQRHSHHNIDPLAPTISTLAASLVAQAPTMKLSSSELADASIDNQQDNSNNNTFYSPLIHSGFYHKDRRRQFHELTAERNDNGGLLVNARTCSRATNEDDGLEHKLERDQMELELEQEEEEEEEGLALLSGSRKAAGCASSPTTASAQNRNSATSRHDNNHNNNNNNNQPNNSTLMLAQRNKIFRLGANGSPVAKDDTWLEYNRQQQEQQTLNLGALIGFHQLQRQQQQQQQQQHQQQQQQQQQLHHHRTTAIKALQSATLGRCKCNLIMSNDGGHLTASAASRSNLHHRPIRLNTTPMLHTSSSRAALGEIK